MYLPVSTWAGRRSGRFTTQCRYLTTRDVTGLGNLPAWLDASDSQYPRKEVPSESQASRSPRVSLLDLIASITQRGRDCMAKRLEFTLSLRSKAALLAHKDRFPHAKRSPVV